MILAATGSIDYGRILFDLFLVLVVAKIAAELVERIRIPAVIGEITAGIIVGPSVLGWVDPSDALKILAEIGVVILLAQVGLEMDLKELRRVGRASFLVAIIGVVAPMSMGVAAGRVLGESTHASLFLGAALAATSVGITARVFGDLRSLSSTEARVVLGAAVADDVLGLIILTVVTRVVDQGSVDFIGVIGTLALALGFLVASGFVGLILIPKMMAMVGPRALSPTTIGVLAAALTFGFSASAHSANLAPIIGAFMAGVALRGAPQHDRIERDFSVIGAWLIPVFFMQIGIDTDVTKFFNGHVLIVAGVLTIIAILAKMLAAIGAFGTQTDKVLVGLGMVPRGEVGLIFATIGVQVGVFDDELYAVVLLVVLLTTLIAPPLLRIRLGRTREESATGTTSTPEPTQGWLTVSNGTIELHGTPSQTLTLTLLLRAAVLANDARPGDALLDWAHSVRSVALTWDDESTTALLELLSRGNSRSWRFIEIVGILDRAAPELAMAINHRRSDASELDPTHAAAFPIVETVRPKTPHIDLSNCQLIVAALCAEITNEGIDYQPLLDRLTIADTTRRQITALVSASTLLHAAISVEPFVRNARVLEQLADYLESPMNVEQCRLLTEARQPLNEWQYSALIDITTSVQSLLAHPELIEGRAGSVEQLRRQEALTATAQEHVRDRIRHAESSYILVHTPEEIVRHARLVEPLPRKKTARVQVREGVVEQTWVVDVATRDMSGLLARMTAVFAALGLDIISADLTTWPDGAVVDSFVVMSPTKPSATQLAHELERAFRSRPTAARRLNSRLGAGLSLRVDHDAHPWLSVITVTGVDQPGLLQSIATAFSIAGINVHHALVETSHGVVTDRFEVSDRHGRKISDASISKLDRLLR